MYQQRSISDRTPNRASLHNLKGLVIRIVKIYVHYFLFKLDFIPNIHSTYFITRRRVLMHYHLFIFPTPALLHLLFIITFIYVHDIYHVHLIHIISLPPRWSLLSCTVVCDYKERIKWLLIQTLRIEVVKQHLFVVDVLNQATKHLWNGGTGFQARVGEFQFLQS